MMLDYCYIQLISFLSSHDSNKRVIIALFYLHTTKYNIFEKCIIFNLSFKTYF
jgi:hypothetical protein